MKTLEIEEKTVDDAINSALKELQVSRDQISVEILEEGTRGLFGIGSKPAKIRVSYGQGEPEPPAPTPSPKVQKKETASSPPKAEQRVKQPDKQSDKQEEAPRVIDEENMEHIVAAAKKALGILLGHLQIEYTVEVKKREDQILLNIHCDNENFLIGRRGTTLDAVQYLVNRIANKHAKDKIQVVLDTSDYRVNRKERLQKLALKLSRKVKMTGKPVTVSPMNPHDRRIIHLALQDDPSVKTLSKGSGFMRRITISSNKHANRNRGKR
jgi:spoIIIJ-associated protein